jgi:hypothetical protein
MPLPHRPIKTLRWVRARFVTSFVCSVETDARKWGALLDVACHDLFNLAEVSLAVFPEALRPPLSKLELYEACACHFKPATMRRIHRPHDNAFAMGAP